MINVPYEDMPREIEALLGEIEQLEQENKQLKEQLEKKYKKVGTLTNEILYEENTKLLFVLDEIREYINKKTWYPTTGDEVCFEKILELTDKDLDDLYEILDKVKE